MGNVISAKHEVRVDAAAANDKAASGMGILFWLLWAGQFVSRLGSAMSVVAVPLLAVNLLHASAVQMGFLSAAQSVPTVLFAVAGGVVADRFSKRRIMICTEIGRALLFVCIGAAAASAHLTMESLYVLMFAAGVLAVFFDVSYTALLPVLVNRQDFLRANTAIQGARNVTSFAGRGLGGALVGMLSASAAMYADAASYVVSLLSILLVRWHDPHPRLPAGRSVTADVSEGFNFVIRDRPVRTLLLYAAVANFAISALFAIYVLYLSAQLHLPAARVGLIVAMLAMGSLLGTLVAPWAGRHASGGRVLSTSALIAAGSAALLSFGTARPLETLLIQGLGLAVLGGALSIANIHITAFTQLATPSALMARTVGTVQFVCSVMLPVGALAGGAVGQYAGARAVIVSVAACFLVSALAIHAARLSDVKPVCTAQPEEQGCKPARPQ